MHDLNSEIIKHYKTSIDQNNEYREYLVYKKGEIFIVECIEWRVESQIQSNGNRNYYEGFKDKKSAIDKYEEIFSIWES